MHTAGDNKYTGRMNSLALTSQVSEWQRFNDGHWSIPCFGPAFKHLFKNKTFSTAVKLTMECLITALEDVAKKKKKSHIKLNK